MLVVMFFTMLLVIASVALRMTLFLVVSAAYLAVLGIFLLLLTFLFTFLITSSVSH